MSTQEKRTEDVWFTVEQIGLHNLKGDGDFRSDEKHLNIHVFSDSQKRASYEKQGGICPHCGGHYEYDQMEGDHITAWHEGGRLL